MRHAASLGVRLRTPLRVGLAVVCRCIASCQRLRHSVHPVGRLPRDRAAHLDLLDSLDQVSFFSALETSIDDSPQPLLLRIPLDRHSTATGSNFRLRRNHRPDGERLRRRRRSHRFRFSTRSIHLHLPARPTRIRHRHSHPRHHRASLLQTRRSQTRRETIASEEFSGRIGRRDYEGAVSHTET